MDQTQEALILTATKGALDYKDVVQAIHAVFPNGKGQAVKPKDKDVFVVAEAKESDGDSDDHEVFEALQGVADQIQDRSDYDSEEALDVYETYKDVKRRVQERNELRIQEG